MGKLIRLFGERLRTREQAFDSGELDQWLPRYSELPELLDHRDEDVRKRAKKAILQFSEKLAAERPDSIQFWKNRVEELMTHDRRTNKFVHSYPRVLDALECLSAVGKWKIQDNDNDLPRFFLYLELESNLATGKREFSDIASEFLDFCGYSYFIDFYPNAVDYMIDLLKGECLPQWEKPYGKVFDRLCKLRQHDKISQIMLSAVVGGDLGRVDWFSRNLYPVHFEKYDAYEQWLLELIGSANLPKDVRENALTALLYIGEDVLLHRQYLGYFIDLVRDMFEPEELDALFILETHPRISKMLTARLRTVRS